MNPSHGNARRRGRSFVRIALAIARSSLCVLVALSARPTASLAQSSAEELILTTRLAVDLANEALEDVVVPLGGLLGRISPSSSYASDAHGLGFAALTLGTVGLQFKMTNPDYDFYRNNGFAETVEGPAAAVYADLELGLYRGVPWGNAHNVGSIDLLLRYGLTLGDQEDLSEDLDVGKVIDTLAPIYGAGARIGLMRGPGLPAVSVSLGFNHFVERSFRFTGDVDGVPFAVGLDLAQTSNFVLLEVAKQFSFLTPYAGVGRVSQAMDASYAADIVVSGSSESSTIGEDVDVRATHTNLFGGLELFTGAPVRLSLEAGSLDGTAYGSVALRIVPFGRHAD